MSYFINIHGRTRGGKLYNIIITILFTAILPPQCEPGCGEKAHCFYGTTNMCKCDKGYTGNPYNKCYPRRHITCSTATCGRNAVCQQTKSHVECLCPPGYLGNPNLQCTDIDECAAKPCAENAICINTPGSFSCICKSHYVGNPYELCSQIAMSKCTDGNVCTCTHNATCPDGFICEKSRCVDVCRKLPCGPKAVCQEGNCLCQPGYIGNPNDLSRGCIPDNHCMSDEDCEDSEICFQLAKNTRRCVDSCSKLQCGPNSLCVSSSHHAHCVCAEGYIGKPNSVKEGCHLVEREPLVEVGCSNDRDCTNQDICIVLEGATSKCVNLCSTVACGSNEHCNVVDRSPRCDCIDGFLWNPVTSECEQPSTPNCRSDNDCDISKSCERDVLGVKKCTDNCLLFTCPQNSICVTKNHKSKCQCLRGFTGNPNERDGCIAMAKYQCSDDAQCRENEICKNIGNGKKCLSACQQVTCGPNAVCVTNNHVAKCQCPSGLFTGEPNNLEIGCQSVSCIYNADCPSHQLCNRMNHKCMDVCDESSCGDNAVCLADNHKTICQCPSGFKPDPIAEINCRKSEVCNPNPCHSSAICEPRQSTYVCKCPIGFTGDSYKKIGGCKKQTECVNDDNDCPLNTVCVKGHCVNPCDGACGINSLCNVVDRQAICICPEEYESVAGGNACKKKLLPCRSDNDCQGDICVEGQCSTACHDSSQCDPGDKCVKNFCTTQCSKHSQCGIGQACSGGKCLIGCRNNIDCSEDESCINNKCINPCLATRICGPNAICTRLNHNIKCECPLGFDGNPTPQQGCIRKPRSCLRSLECPPDHMCIGHLCQVPCQSNSGCAIGEKCSDNMCLKMCHSSSTCLHGEHCSFGTCVSGCKVDSDCTDNQICTKSKCQCAAGFELRNNDCININECSNSPCHPSSQCIDTLGSYKCTCPTGAIGDPYTNGCLLPNQCRRDTECMDILKCIKGKCFNPCTENICGENAICTVARHRVDCSCNKGFLGNPFDKNIGCFKVECVDNNDCPSDKNCNTRSNKCTGE